MTAHARITAPAATLEDELGQVFALRAEARALLYRVGALTLHEAVDTLQHDAERSGVELLGGQNRVQDIIAAALAAARDDLDDDPERDAGPPTSVLKCAEWLFFQTNSPKRFRTWLMQQAPAERAAIIHHLKNRRSRP